MSKCLNECCCECKSFRPRKPENEYCISKKEKVNPFGHCLKFKTRSGIATVDTKYDRLYCQENGTRYEQTLKEKGISVGILYNEGE